MLFEKITVSNENEMGVLNIVCCSGSSCKDGTSGKVYDNSKNKSSQLYGPKHSGSGSCTS